MPMDFMRFPLEIREQIYAEALERKWTREESEARDIMLDVLRSPNGEPSPIHRKYAQFVHSFGPSLHAARDAASIRPALALLRASKQIHAEASAVLYARNTFRVGVSESEHMACDMGWNEGARMRFAARMRFSAGILDALGPAQLAQVQSVYVELWAPCVIDYNKSIWHRSFRRLYSNGFERLCDAVARTGVRALAVWVRTDCYEAAAATAAAGPDGDGDDARPARCPCLRSKEALAFDPNDEMSAGRAERYVEERTITFRTLLDPLKRLGKMVDLNKVIVFGEFMSAEYMQELEDALLDRPPSGEAVAETESGAGAAAADLGWV